MDQAQRETERRSTNQSESERRNGIVLVKQVDTPKKEKKKREKLDPLEARTKNAARPELDSFLRLAAGIIGVHMLR